MDWHFSLRKEKEREYFKDHTDFHLKQGIDYLEIQPEKLNSHNTINFVKDLSPEVVVVYGTSPFKRDLLSLCPKYTINCHAGLSP